MANTATPIEYSAANVVCKGIYFTPAQVNGSLPVILVAPAWDGLNQEVRDKAAKLADAGYIAFAID